MVCLLLAACGSKPPVPAAVQPEPPPAAKVALPDVPFDQLDHDQRAEFMKQKVVPAMAPLFQQHDPKKYSEFGCKTCHGKQASDQHFDMPNPELPKLAKDAMPTFKKEDVEWMMKEVKPAMAKLLQQSEWSPQNPKGFGCHGCHTVDE